MSKLSLRLTGALFVAALATSLTGAPASAQAPAPAAPAAQAPAPAAAHLAAARQLVMASGLSKAFGTVVPELMGKINANLSPTRPEIAKDLKATLDALQPELLLYNDEMINFAALVYTTVLNEQECKDALAFYTSPIGKKYVDVQPTVFANLTPAMGEWSKSVSVRMFERVRAEMKKKGHEF
jgi:hypothetical protein